MKLNPRIDEALKILLTSLLLAVSFSYFLARFYLHLQDPIEAFLGVITLTFLAGLIRKAGTLTSIFYRGILTFILIVILSAAIAAFTLVYPLTVLEINVSEAYIIFFLGLVTWPFSYVFFSIGVVFMIIGQVLSGSIYREKKRILPVESYKWSLG